MPEVRLTAGAIEYEDSGEPPGRSRAAADGHVARAAEADHPSVVLLHDLLATTDERASAAAPTTTTETADAHAH